jgi:hypothetical protein
VLNWGDPDIVQIVIPFTGIISTPLDQTNGVAVAAGDATNIRDYTTGSIVDLSASPFNFIKVDTAVNGTGLTAQTGFNASLGAGSIHLGAGTNSVLWAYFDSAHTQMVLGTISAPANFDVIATVGMSQAQYNAFDASHLQFISSI